jgi:hypothetical protein
MKTVHYNPSKVTVEGGGSGFPAGLAAVVVLVVVAAGPAAAVAHAVGRVLSYVLWFAAALAFSAGCGLFARWFGQREKRRELERMRAAEPRGLRWRDGEPMREPRGRVGS